MTGNELGGGLFAGHAGGALVIHVVGFKHIEARNAAHNTLLHQLLRQVALLDIVLVQHQHLQILRGCDEETAIGRHALAAQHALGLQRQLIGVALGGCGLGGADGGTGGTFQRGNGLLVDGQGQRVTGAVQTVGHNIIRHAVGVVAVDQLVHGLVVVDVQVQIGGGARLGSDAVGLVVLLDGHLGVTDRDLDLAGGGVALVAAVEDEVITGHQLVAQLCVHQSGPTFLICMCHKNYSLSPCCCTAVRFSNRGCGP